MDGGSIHPLSEWLQKERSEDARSIATDFFRFLGNEIETQLGFELWPTSKVE